MSLGVLNNLSAMYAANNLNNTTNSLTTVLQQLSSGSKINSGADDAAGLSLVNGLQANSMALAQSQTNAAEGVGLLKVADGALSQVTNLLNRAVTLATEASNGTLNASQDAAANSEYQSILSEINNIGATTTYNGQTVFGKDTSIFTGDSTTVGSSIDLLHVGSLSSSNVGNSGGVMAYSNGTNNVFLNLSTSSANAKATDSLSGTNSSITVNYLVQGGNGASTTATTNITVGTGTNYANTAQGLISAINNSGLGLTASFTTQANAGVSGGGTQTGIEISGGLVSAGIDPGSSSTSGSLNVSGLAANATLALGSTINIAVGSGATTTFTIGASNNTLATLAQAIQGAGIGVNASVITNGDGTQSLNLADSTAGAGALKVTTTAGTIQTPTFTTGAAGTTQGIQGQGADSVGTKSVTAVTSTVTVGTGNGGALFSDQLTAGSSITISNTIPNNPQTLTFVVGKGTDTATTFFTGNHSSGDTLGSLADTINAKTGTLGAYATVTSGGLQVSAGTWTGGNYATTGGSTTIAATQSALTGENISATSTLSSATSGTKLVLYSPTVGGVAGGGQPQVMAFSSTNAGVAVAAASTNTLTGSFQVTGSQGASATFTMGPSDTYDSLIASINGANVGVSASWNANLEGAGKGGLVLTSTDSTNVMSVTNSLTDATAAHALTQNAVHVVSFGSGVANATTDSLAGGASTDFTIVGSAGTYTSSAADTTIGNLITHINASATGLQASFSANLNGGKGGILLIDSKAGQADTVTAGSLIDTTAGATAAPALSAASGNGVQETMGLSLGAAGAQGDFLSGSVQIVGPHGATTFTGNGTSTTYDSLVTAINNANIGVTAVFSANADGAGHVGVKLTGSDTSNVIAFNNNTLVDTTAANHAVATTHSFAAGNNDTNVATASTAVLQLSGANINDSTSTMNGAIKINYNSVSQVFVMGADPGSASAEHVANAIYTGGTTVQSLVNAINSSQTGGQTNNLNSGGTTFQASAPGGGTGGIFLQGMAGNPSAITLTAIDPTAGNGISSPLSVTSAMTAGATTNGVTGVTGVNAGDSITTGGTTIATGDTVAGSITVTNGGTNVGLVAGANATVGLPSSTNVYATGSTSVNDTLTSGTTFSFTTNAGNTFSYTAAASDTWQTLVNNINSSATVGSGVATGVTAAWSASAGGAGNGGIVLTNNYNGSTNVTVNASTLTDQTMGGISAHNTTQTAGESVQAGGNGAPTITGFKGGTSDLVGDTLTADSSATFTVNGQSYTFTAAHAGTDTWQTLINGINNSSIGTANPYGVTASWSANADGASHAGMVLTNNWNGANPVTFTAGGIALAETGGAVAKTQTQAGGGTPTVSVLDAGAAAAATDSLTGSITMTVGGQSFTYAATNGDNWQSLVNQINSSAIGTANNSGVTAKWNANAGGTGIGGIVLTGNETGANPIAVTGNSLVDQATAVTDTFTAGVGANTANHFYTQATNGATYANTLAGLASMVSAQSGTLNVSAQANASGLTFTQTVANGGSIATSANGLTDVTAGSYNKATSSQLASQNDTLSGSLVFTVAGNSQAVNMSSLTDKSAAGLITYINQNSSTLGVSAAWVPSAGPNTNFGSIQLTSGTQGASGTVTVSPLTSLTDTTSGASLSYTAGAAYNTGISASISDAATGQTGAAQLASQNLSGSGVATISYSDGAGVSLNSTSLSNQTAARAALASLNSAITAVAAQDGYLGAQINTLNSVSSVLSTQQQNVVSAQNAVQATDYATAASNMSKYEILSQTGISALAQANSMQQEVTKLLQ